VHCAAVSDGDGKRLIRRLQSASGGFDEAAARVYNRWCGGYFDKQMAKATASGESVNILAHSANFPLCIDAGGHVATRTEQQQLSRTVSMAIASTSSPTVLLHPAEIHADGSLSLYAEAPVGSRLRLLCGTPASLVRKIAVTRDALDDRAPFSRESILGALFFFCGGTMDAVVHDAGRGAAAQGDGAESVRSAFAHACGGGKPFMVVHPFGEQCFQIGWRAPVHANLMFGGVIFGRATYGLQHRGHIFLSYNWGLENKTQKLVLPLKVFLENNTQLKIMLA
jgi:hypothetical protein